MEDGCLLVVGVAVLRTGRVCAIAPMELLACSVKTVSNYGSMTDVFPLLPDFSSLQPPSTCSGPERWDMIRNRKTTLAINPRCSFPVVLKSLLSFIESNHHGVILRETQDYIL